MKFLKLPENYSRCGLSSITADASACVGAVLDDFGSEAAMWVDTEQCTVLGHLEGDNRCGAHDISNNGVVVGRSSFTQENVYSSSRGFFWSQETGMVSIGRLLGNQFPTGYDSYRAEKLVEMGLL